MRTIWTFEDSLAGFLPKEVVDIDSLYENYVAGIPSENRCGVYHPSAVGMCPRRNVMERGNYPFDEHTIPADLREIFDTGHKVHDLVQGRLEGLCESLRQRGYHATFIREVPYDPDTDVLFNEFGIGGTADGILEIGKDGWLQRGIIEVKSIASKSYARLSGMKAEHLDQSTLYAYRFQVPIIWGWYFNKDASTRRVMPQRVDMRRVNKLLEMYAEWEAHHHAGTLPDRRESLYECRTCPFQTACAPSVLQPGARAPKRAVVNAPKLVSLRRSR